MFNVNPDDAKKYIEVVRRLSSLLCLASLLPVLSDCRFVHYYNTVGERRRHLRRQDDASQKTAAKDKAGKDDAARPEASATEESEADKEREPKVALSVASVVFFAASELTRCYEIFTPSKKSGGVHALVKAVKKSIDKAYDLRKGGFMDKATTFCMALFESEAIFTSIHGLAMLAVLAIVFAYVVRSMLLSPQDIMAKAKLVFGGIAMVLPLGIFVNGYQQILLKAWKALVADKVVGSLWLPLRALAILSANPPDVLDEKAGGTPGLFSALQVASLFGTFSCEVLANNQSFAQSLGKFQANPNLSVLENSPVLTVIAPLMISVGWLYFAHLWRRPGSLLFSMPLSIMSSPFGMAVAWPKLAAALGMTVKSGPTEIMNFLSVFYAFAVTVTVMMGGTLSFVGLLLLLHLMNGIHGLEALGFTPS